MVGCRWKNSSSDTEKCLSDMPESWKEVALIAIFGKNIIAAGAQASTTSARAREPWVFMLRRQADYEAISSPHDRY